MIEQPTYRRYTLVECTFLIGAFMALMVYQTIVPDWAQRLVAGRRPDLE